LLYLQDVVSITSKKLRPARWPGGSN
jgi:hypothetical protein